jgi:mRNA interferase RelE/StbE
LAFSLEYREAAAKQLRKLDRPVAASILNYLDQVVAMDDPRLRGKGLVGELSGYWRYRVGDYRIVCRILDAQLVVIALEISHRSAAYR